MKKTSVPLLGKKALSVPEQHQRRIAAASLRMPNAMLGVMGGPSKSQARRILKGNPHKTGLKYSVGVPTKIDSEEWRVMWFVFDRPYEPGAYYTDDKQDALDTAQAMQCRADDLNQNEGNRSWDRFAKKHQMIAAVKNNPRTNPPRQDLADVYKTDPVKACRLALAYTKNVRWQDRMDAIDKLLGTFGVEAIRGEWQNGYWADIVATYCNTGDTYALTVLHVRGDWSGSPGRFFVSSWGDWVEKNSRSYHLE